MKHVIAFVVLLVFLPVSVGHAQDPVAPAEPATPAPTLRITSPLGRTGAPANIRIVAQIRWPAEIETRALPPLTVRFLVDGALVGTVDSGPPFAVTWADENPFESREIVVEAEDPSGTVIRDTVTLPPFEITDRTEVGSIVVDAVVFDHAGHAVSDLDTKAFTLRENGEPQTADLVARETEASTVVLLVDNSQSMARRMPAVRHAVGLFAGALGQRDKIIVVPFNQAVGAITGPTADIATIMEAIGAMKAGGGTAILNAVDQVAKLLHGVEGRRAVILMTDGFDENSTIDFQTALGALLSEQITVYTVAVGGVTGVSLHGENIFRKLADGKGGRTFFPWREIDLLQVAREVANDEHSRYVIAYTPTNQTKDGTWREITIEVPKGYRARGRSGYRAALPPPVRPAIEFTVTDPSRHYVNIAAEDLEVTEDGVPQSIDTFQEAVDPVAITLLLDASGSMTKSAEAVRQTAREFVAAVRPEDSLGLTTFADEPVIAHLVGTNRQISYDAIDKYTTAGGTALYDGLWNALQQLKRVPGRRAIVLLSDGRDENNPGTAPGSAHTLEEVLELGREVGATIFPIGLGTRVDKPVLERLAQTSGGNAYFSLEAAQLGDQFRGIIENLRQRYILSYTSTNAKHNGAWRNVRIKPRQATLSVTTNGGYFAPDP